MSDKLTRVLAAIALGVALVALVLAAYAVSLGAQYRDDMRTLSTTLQDLARREHGQGLDVPLHRPPATLDVDDR